MSRRALVLALAGIICGCETLDVDLTDQRPADARFILPPDASPSDSRPDAAFGSPADASLGDSLPDADPGGPPPDA